MVPVPTEISKNPFCWQYTAPERAARPFGQSQAQDFNGAFVLREGSDKGFVVSNGPQQISGTRFHIQIEEYFDCRHDQKKNHNGAEFIQGRGEPVYELIVKDRIPAENRQICLIARDSKIQRIQGRHDDNSRKKVAHLQFDMNQSG